MNKKVKDIIDYVIIVIVVILIRTFIITPALVDGSSMDNTLHDGQLVIINKYDYMFNDIDRFDIVVVNNREDGDKIIKRVIGLPNETIKYKDNILYINDKKVIEEYSIGDTFDFEYKTGKDEYFVLGDNREVSKDSRYLGNFKSNDILGSVNFRLFPFSKFGKVDK